MRTRWTPVFWFALCFTLTLAAGATAEEPPLAPAPGVASGLAAPRDCATTRPAHQPVAGPERMLAGIFAPVEPEDRAICSGQPCPWVSGCCYNASTGCCYGGKFTCSIC